MGNELGKTPKKLKIPKEITLIELENRPLGMIELIVFLSENGYPEPIARELFWRLEKDGLARINLEWKLEKF
jgi:hypothetical protein